MKNTLIAIALLLVGFVGYRLFFSGYEIRNPNPAGENIISFGDSLTYGTGARPGMSYPAQLSLKISLPVINAGVPGETTSGAQARLEEDVLSRSPKMVLITLGGNDLKNGLSKESAFENLKAIIERIHDEGALVVIGGIDVPLYGRGFGEAYEELARETGSVLIPNLFDGIMGHSELMSDLIHPNGRGYTIMADKFYDAIEPYL